MVPFLVKSRPEHEREADPMRTKKIVSKALLQNMLDQFVIWHRSLLQYIVRHTADLNMVTTEQEKCTKQYEALLVKKPRIDY